MKIKLINEWKSFKQLNEVNNKDYLKWKRNNVSYRGINNTDNLENGGSAILGRGLYSASLSNKSMAKGYGDLYFVVNAIPKNPLVFNDLNSWEIYLYNTLIFKYSKEKGKKYPDKRDFNEHTTIEDEIQKLGYDGVIIKGREYVNYKPKNVLYFKDESQLISYYELNKSKLIQESINLNKDYTIKQTSEDDDRSKFILYFKNGDKIGSITYEKVYDATYDMVLDEDEYLEFFPDNEFIKIEHLEVKKEYSNKGYGKILINLVIEETKKNTAFNRIYLNASPMGSQIPLNALIKLYEDCGFKVFNHQGNNAEMYKVV
jgi:GNAT superfamily N-acetyltransferase